MITPVQSVKECCYRFSPNPPDSHARYPRMQLGRPLDLSGLTTALCVEEAGAWHLYNPETHIPPAKAAVLEVYGQIIACDAPHKMPQDPRLLRLLVDAAAALHGEKTRAIGWQILGVKPNRGRTLLSKDLTDLEWPIWHTALNFGLGHSRFEHPDEYFGRS